jgi:hypothetical protein
MQMRGGPRKTQWMMYAEYRHECYANLCIVSESPLRASMHVISFPSVAHAMQDLRSDIVQLTSTLQALLNGVAAILRVAEEHLRAGHVEHGVRDVGYWSSVRHKS